MKYTTLTIISTLISLMIIATLQSCKEEPVCNDLDMDTICDINDDDIDGDFIRNENDPFPSDRYICGDSDSDGCDDCKSLGYSTPQFDGCSTPPAATMPEAEVLAHLKDFGDKGYAQQPASLGTAGLGRQIEGIIIRMYKGSAKIRYKGYFQDLGNGDWVYNGDLCGTKNQKRRMEAFWVEFVDQADKDKYSIQYTCYAQSRGWLPWSKDGQMSGTVGEGRQLEDIRVMIVPK